MSIQETNLKAIADAIRAKTGETGKIVANDFATKIADIQTGVAKPSWVQNTMPNSMAWSSVCYGNGKFVAVAENSNVAAYSTNGINWTRAILPDSAQQWRSVCYGNGKFVAVAAGTDYGAYSPNGVTWAKMTLPGIRNWNSVCYGNGKFVALCGMDTQLPAYSTDGINWSSGRLPASSNWSSVCYGNGKFVAVTNGSNVAAYSTNGNDWTQATLPIVAYCTSVCYGDGKFVAVTGSGGYGKILYSTDGSTWNATSFAFTDISTPLPANINWSSVCYGNDKFVAVANGSNIAAYGIGGISWSQTTMPDSLAWYSVCYGAGKFVAVARGGTAYAYIKDYFDEWA